MWFICIHRNVIKAFDVSVLQARVAVVEYSTSARLTIGIDDYAAQTPLLCAIDKLVYSSKSCHILKDL